MLQREEESIRRYRTIDYEAFEELLISNSLWMSAFKNSITDIDFETIDPNDFRGKQLADLALAVSKLLVAIARTAEGDMVSADALEAANKILVVGAKSTSP